MRKRRPMMLAVPFLLFLSSAGFSQDRAASRPGGETVVAMERTTGSCRTIAAILSVYPPLEVQTSEGAIQDDRDGSEHPGCRVHASGPSSGTTGEVPPEEAIRFLLGESGWEEDFRYAADRPGTASLTLRRNGIFCLFRGGVRSSVDNGKIPAADRYEGTAVCFTESKGE
jgi:hypothetical protein